MSISLSQTVEAAALLPLVEQCFWRRGIGSWWWWCLILWTLISKLQGSWQLSRQFNFPWQESPYMSKSTHLPQNYIQRAAWTFILSFSSWWRALSSGWYHSPVKLPNPFDLQIWWSKKPGLSWVYSELGIFKMLLRFEAISPVDLMVLVSGGYLNDCLEQAMVFNLFFSDCFLI